MKLVRRRTFFLMNSVEELSIEVYENFETRNGKEKQLFIQISTIEYSVDKREIYY